MDIQFTRGRLSTLSYLIWAVRERVMVDLLRVSSACRDEHDNAPEWQRIVDDLKRAHAALFDAAEALDQASSGLWGLRQ